MSDDAEQQADEIEVLKSIYEGDESFKQVDAKTYQYKYTDGDKSFVLEILWGPTYPTEKPSFNLEIFYNQHLLPAVKAKILSVLNEEADQWVGCAMTYTLFECLKEKMAEVLAEQAEEAVVSSRVEKIVIEDQIPDKDSRTDKEEREVSQDNQQGYSGTFDNELSIDSNEPTKKVEKKEQLTKSQKRRAWDRAESGRGGEKPRGWDWMDIVKHLSQAPHHPPAS